MQRSDLAETNETAANDDTKLIDLKLPDPTERTYGLLDKVQLSIQNSLDDARSPKVLKALFAEFLGTMMLVMVAVGSTVQLHKLDVVQIALTFGLCVATVVCIIGNHSGGHVNPAVTIAMLVTRRISIIKALLYIVVQCLGATIGSAIVKGLTPEARRGGLGTSTLSEGVTPTMGFGIEFCITALLVLTVFATCDRGRTDHQGSFPLAIGFSVTVGHLWAVEFCGSSMNPARSFGPAIVMNIWKDHWVYWLGPFSGGIFAGLLYDLVLAEDASFEKFRSYLTSSHFNEDSGPRSPMSPLSPTRKKEVLKRA